MSSGITDVTDDISSAIKAGSSKELSRYLNYTVTLTIGDEEDAYSKEQASLILKDFFIKNPPESFSIMHKGASRDGSQYAIGRYISGNKAYRTYFLLKKAGDRFLIDALSFELDGSKE